MLDSQNRLQNYLKNAKTTKFLSELAFYTSEGHTCKVLSFYDFWFTFNDKFCSPYPIVDFYAYLITKIGNCNLKQKVVHKFFCLKGLILLENGKTGLFCFIRVGEASILKICHTLEAVWHNVLNCCTMSSAEQPQIR